MGSHLCQWSSIFFTSKTSKLTQTETTDPHLICFITDIHSVSVSYQGVLKYSGLNSCDLLNECRRPKSTRVLMPISLTIKGLWSPYKPLLFWTRVMPKPRDTTSKNHQLNCFSSTYWRFYHLELKLRIFRAFDAAAILPER